MRSHEAGESILRLLVCKTVCARLEDCQIVQRLRPQLFLHLQDNNNSHTRGVLLSPAP